MSTNEYEVTMKTSVCVVCGIVLQDPVHEGYLICGDHDIQLGEAKTFCHGLEISYWFTQAKYSPIFHLAWDSKCSISLEELQKVSPGHKIYVEYLLRKHEDLFQEDHHEFATLGSLHGRTILSVPPVLTMEDPAAFMSYKPLPPRVNDPKRKNSNMGLKEVLDNAAKEVNSWPEWKKSEEHKADMAKLEQIKQAKAEPAKPEPVPEPPKPEDPTAIRAGLLEVD